MRRSWTALMALALAAAAGCAGPSDDAPVSPQYALDFPGDAWRVTVWVNGQPAQCRAGGGILGTLTPFVVDGKNAFRIVAEPRPGRVLPDAFEVHLCAIGDPSDPDSVESVHRFALEGPPEGEAIEHSFTYDAAVPFRWAWQEADEIGAFAEADRQAVLELIDRLAELMRRRDWDALEKPSSWRVAFWPGGKSLNSALFPFLDEYFGKIYRALDGYEDYAVTVVPQERLRFQVGTKVVYVRVQADGPSAFPQHEIIRGGRPEGRQTPPDEIDWSIGLEEAFFAKINGRWRMLF